MKRVIIVRHAKAVPYGYDDDFSRDLTDRGINDAEKIGKRLKEMGIVPDLVIASPALRAMDTATIFCKTLGYNITFIHQEIALYEEIDTKSFVSMLKEVPEIAHTVFIFGHNPTVCYLINNLAGNFNGKMPTCTAVGIDFQVEKWKDVSSHGGEIAFQFIPKKI